MPNCCAMRILPSAWAVAATPNASAVARRMFLMFMLASEREVALDGGAIEPAAQVLGGAGRQVHHRAVVPEHHVVRLPLVAVEEFRADAEREQFVQYGAALVLGQADDAGGEVLADEQRLAPGL